MQAESTERNSQMMAECTTEWRPILAPEQADVVVVRSATLFRAGWAGLFSEALVLDLPGASTPRLDTLELVRTPRPLYPLDV